MNSRKRFIIGILVIIIILAMIKFLLFIDSDNVTDFDEILSEFSFVQSVDFYGNSPSLFLSFEIDKSIANDQVDRVFIRVRDILFEKDNLTSLMNFHKAKYGGTVTNLHIIFTYSNNDKMYYHDYYSISDTSGEPNLKTFINWKVDRNGVEQDFLKW